MISIIAIGKRHEPWIETGVEMYSMRLRAPWDIKWVLLPHSSSEGAVARQNESQAILERLSPSDTVILLDERGTMYDSPTLSSRLSAYFTQGKQVVVVIGGAYGVSEALQQRATETWSLSQLVFPHQLVRLLLVEQFYRAEQIHRGGKYHHE